MKIAVNIQPLLNPGKSGIGFYQSEILKALLSRGGGEFFLQYFDPDGSRRAAAEKYLTGNARDESCHRISSKLYQLIWTFFPLPYRLFFKSRPDISVFFNYYLPPGVRGRRVLTVYDTVIKDHPETVRFKTKMMLKLTLRRSIRRADRIITISQFSKRQIMKHYGVDEKKIAVIPCAADAERFYPLNDEERISAVKAKYAVSGDYFLYLGNLEPRKNIPRLIEAYSIASEKKELPKLVLAGGKGWLYDGIFAKVNELGLNGSVIFTGYIDDEDVSPLMNGARAFCFPSLYEGFGMPPLEAMACGIPVIVSNTTSIPEVTNGCGIAVDPLNTQEIADALIKMCDKELALREGRRGLERSRDFSWEKSAEMLSAVFKELLDE